MGIRNIFKNKLPKLGIFTSSIGILTGIRILTDVERIMVLTRRVSESTYGGDAYTGIQNATAITASNLYALNEGITMLVKAMAVLLIVFSVSKLIYFINYLKYGNPFQNYDYDDYDDYD